MACSLGAPQPRRYCGSCWSHGSVSALGDRIKIARKGKGIDINLSVQHMLNCGNVGSCHGGSVDGPYQWIHKLSRSGTGISYETQQPYLACSSESNEGICGGPEAESRAEKRLALSSDDVRGQRDRCYASALDLIALEAL